MAVALLGISGGVQAQTPAPYSPVPPALFAPLPSLSAPVHPVSPNGVWHPQRPKSARSATQPVIRVSAPNRPVRPALRRSYPLHSLVGTATTYCRPQDYWTHACMARHPDGGHWAAAGPRLRAAIGGGDHCVVGPGCWRDVRVTVCNGPVCSWAILADWCRCPGDHVIDLYGTVMARIDPGYLVNGGVADASIRW